MDNLLTGGIANIVGNALNGLFLPATLIRYTPVVSADAADPDPPTESTYTCKAIVENYSQRFRIEGLVQENERKVIILATSISVTPKPGDRITIRGITFTIEDVATDPALATWECRGKM